MTTEVKRAAFAGFVAGLIAAMIVVAVAGMLTK